MSGHTRPEFVLLTLSAAVVKLSERLALASTATELSRLCAI
jgi:hypothetical protein